MLVPMEEILGHANASNYGVAAPNVETDLEAIAYIEAAEQLNAPLIIDLFAPSVTDIYYTCRMIRDLASRSCVPIALNLDHGGEKQEILRAINAGVTSIMVDRSSLPFDQNAAEVKELADIAHACGISVEAELGHVGQADNYAQDRDAALTSVEDAQRYIELTGVDCLAVAIGTAHGAYPEGFVPYLDFDRLAEIKAGTGNFPLVLHGSSGTSKEDLAKACRMGINKVNISNDLLKAIVAELEATDLHGGNAYNVFVAAKKGAKDKLLEMIKVYGSDGKAWDVKPAGLPVMDTTAWE